MYILFSYESYGQASLSTCISKSDCLSTEGGWYMSYTGRLLPYLTGSRLCASWQMVTTGCEVDTNFADESVCLMAKLLTLWATCRHYV
jgi:hypothetical protein